MDWLRIGAFALLILYHIGLVFVPWNFHLNLAPPVGWAVLPMLAINAWRLTLLFVVSGYASRALLAKSPGLAGFARNRSVRLLVPLAFGIAVIVPPQAWAELVGRHGYAQGYLHFWAHDYFAFAVRDGVMLPAWNHLWFVAYLWAYTILVVALVGMVGRWRWQHAFNRAFGGAGVLWWPLVWLVLVHGWWFPMRGETHALIDDGVAHASYLPAFLFGFGLARSEHAMAAIARRWRWGLALALAGYGTILGFELAQMNGYALLRWVRYPYGIAHAFQQWGAIVALIGIAERWWNRDAAIRPRLTEAVFPFYLIHQTIIVVVTLWLLEAGWPRWGAFAALVAATVGGCWAFYLVGRGVRPLRPLIGLRAR